MSLETQLDEFDSAGGVGGKHLAPKRPADYIISFLTLTLVSMMLAGGGIAGLQILDASVIFSASVVEEEPIDSGLPTEEIAIVDATNSIGLSKTISDQLIELGWNVVSASSLKDQDPSLPASPATLIFISWSPIDHWGRLCKLSSRMPRLR
jgi:hypothetical protein